jgi:hypothetical protein
MFWAAALATSINCELELKAISFAQISMSYSYDPVLNKSYNYELEI